MEEREKRLLDLILVSNVLILGNQLKSAAQGKGVTRMGPGDDYVGEAMEMIRAKHATIMTLAKVAIAE